MRDVFNPCRIFAANDEKGMVICEWPEGAYKPMIPIPYTEECMTGFEYAAAGLMLQEGFVEEGIAVVVAIRDRYDGKKRNPYAEIECGSSYARSMASFALPAIFSGFKFDMTKKQIGFSPILKNKPFRCFWSVQDSWGTVSIEEDRIVLSVLYGTLPLNTYLLEENRTLHTVTADGKDVPFALNGICVNFGTTLDIRDQLILRYT